MTTARRGRASAAPRYIQPLEIDGVEYRWETRPYADGYFTAAWWRFGEKERHELGYGLNSHTAVAAEMEELISNYHRSKTRAQP